MLIFSSLQLRGKRALLKIQERVEEEQINFHKTVISKQSRMHSLVEEISAIYFILVVLTS